MLDFSLSRQQKMVKKEVAKLVKDKVADLAHEMDENGIIPESVLQKAWELGLSIANVPEKYGGFGMEGSAVESAIAIEELAFGDMAFAVAALLPSLFIQPVLSMGTKEQQDKYLPLFCNKDFTPGSLAICEPHFGSDPSDLRTKAEKKGGSYVLNGKKCFVPMAEKASHIITAASLDGLNQLFIISKDNPGVKIGEREKNLGLYALETYELVFENCEIPAEDMLGGENGCDYDNFLQRTRIAMSAMGTGLSRASFMFAKKYAKERVQFGEPIASRQSIAFMIAEMAYEVDAMRLMTFQAASRLDAGKDSKRESYMAKLYAGEMAMKISDYGVQVLGGHGYIKEYPVERFYRNGRSIANLEGLAIV